MNGPRVAPASVVAFREAQRRQWAAHHATDPDVGELADVAISSHGATYHRPGDERTACGEVAMADAVRPLPSEWTARVLFGGRRCLTCWP